MSGSNPLRAELGKALLSAHHSAKDDKDYLAKVSLAFKRLFDFTEDFNGVVGQGEVNRVVGQDQTNQVVDQYQTKQVVDQGQANDNEKTEMTLATLPLLPLEKIASFLDFKSLVS